MGGWRRWLMLIWVLSVAGCGMASAPPPSRPTPAANSMVAVDVAVATAQVPSSGLVYTGTTAPLREVVVRSRIEGRLLTLTVDVGDAVRAGQVIAQLDDATPAVAVLQSEAEVIAREAEVAQVSASINAAKARVEEARLNWQRAEIDARRLKTLAQEGAIPQKAADDAETNARTALQSLRAAEAQVIALQQSAESAQSRVESQRAIVQQQQERLSYTTITAPIDGFVLARSTEPGSLLFAGNEVLKLGDLQEVKVMVMVSELEIGKIRLGSPARVRLDAIPQQTFTGKVTRIAPSADPIARQIPVEVTVSNPNNLIGSGQLARVEFVQNTQPRVLVPLSALPERRRSSEGEQPNKSEPKRAQLFVIEQTGEKMIVRSRQVTLGDQRDGRVEILKGLQEGERYVARSGGQLQDGDEVRVSALSDNPDQPPRRRPAQ